MFYTVGTSQKQWYCPSIGETYVLFAYLPIIAESFSKVISNGFDSINMLLNGINSFHSSTQSSLRAHFSIETRFVGEIANTLKAYTYNCLAFLTI